MLSRRLDPKPRKRINPTPQPQILTRVTLEPELESRNAKRSVGTRRGGPLCKVTPVILHGVESPERDCAKSLRLSHTGLYPQTFLHAVGVEGILAS